MAAAAAAKSAGRTIAKAFWGSRLGMAEWMGMDPSQVFILQLVVLRIRRGAALGRPDQCGAGPMHCAAPDPCTRRTGPDQPEETHRDAGMPVYSCGMRWDEFHQIETC